MVAFLVSSGYNKFTTFVPPLEKHFGLPLKKSTIAPTPGKNPSNVYACRSHAS